MKKMIQTITQNLGVDISKDQLDVCLSPDNTHRQFPNNKKGHKALIQWLRPFDLEYIVYEATGAYHRSFEQALGIVGLPLAKVNPCQARRFAQATGTRAKTDRVDAAMLAMMGALLKPVKQKPKSQTQYDLAELLTARNGLVKDRTAILNRQKNLTVRLLKQQARRRLKQVDGLLGKIDEQCLDLVAALPELQERLDILVSIPGIGEQTAIMLLVEMPELGTLDPKQAGSLAGLAPVTRQSGKWQGKSFIQGGRKRVRTGLYMPTLVTIRFNPSLKQKYDGFRDKGKPAKLAITAIMRKLVILANSLLRDNRKWSETRP